MGPNYWFFSPALPEELLTSLTEALRLAPGLHAAAMELAVLVDHCEQLRVGGFAELRTAGVAIPLPELEASA
jgi:hypothetical protein